MVVVPRHKAESATAPEVPRVAAEDVEGPLLLIIDRQPLFLAALGTLLTAPPVSARLRYAQGSDDGLAIVEQGGVDLVFCELRAGPISALSLAQRLAELTPKVPVIVLGDSEDEHLLSAAVQDSVAGVFTKDAALDEFLVGVSAVLAGHRAVGAKLMTRLLGRLAEQPTAMHRTQKQLSATELDILRMVGEAQSIQAIALSRGISHKTVRNHLANIYRKLDLRSRTEAMLFAARMGLTSS
jgi:DNA-binding NarL/FixJ family response regulator